MFIQNRHTAVYWSIVTRARSELRKKRGSEYYESHHIVPRALGGTDDEDNLVLLTEREHYLCHRLLTRMTEGRARSKMACAFRMMVFGPNKHQAKHRFPSSLDYVAARKAAKLIDRTDGVAKMAASLTGRKLSDKHKANISKNNARTMAKSFDVIDPSGTRTTIHNLRLWCAERGFAYQNAYLSAKLGRVCRNKGPMQGYQFVRLST